MYTKIIWENSEALLVGLLSDLDTYHDSYCSAKSVGNDLQSLALEEMVDNEEDYKGTLLDTYLVKGTEGGFFELFKKMLRNCHVMRMLAGIDKSSEGEIILLIAFEEDDQGHGETKPKKMTIRFDKNGKIVVVSQDFL